MDIGKEFSDVRGADDAENWLNPLKRGVFPIGGFHMSRSLRRRILKLDYEAPVCSLDEVVSACAARSETWINKTIYDIYCQMAEQGLAHSLKYGANRVDWRSLWCGRWRGCFSERACFQGNGRVENSPRLPPSSIGAYRI